jgi:large repetitive protein
MSTGKLAAAVLLSLAVVLGATALAHAETVDCTAITALPTVITVQGVYCVTGDLSTASTTGNAIDIQAPNVVLDLNGFTLDGSGAGAGTQAVGIHALNLVNITLKNGTIRGFLRGIFLEDSGGSQGHVVQDVRADRNTFVGLQVEGKGILVRHSQAAGTGGTTTFGANADAIGILAAGSGPRVVESDVTDTTKQGTGTAVGIQFKATTVGGLAEDNRVTTADKGVEFLSGGTGKCRNNLIFSVTTPFVGCTDASNNSAPAITSASSVTFAPGLAGQTFLVTTTGSPTNTITRTGTLPSGVTFTDNLNNTATIAGTPAAGTQTSSPYAWVITAANGNLPNATQNFTFNVVCPTIVVSGTIPDLTLNQAMATATFTQTGGNGTIVWSQTGLPNGVNINSSSGDVSGTPTQSGSFSVTITATDAGNCTGSKSQTVHVNAPPAITSAASATFAPGLAGQTFTVQTTGFPTNTISRTGTLPSGVTFTDNLDNTATIAGTPAAGTQTSSPYAWVITAANGTPPDATQNFTFNVVCPTITVSGTIPALTFNVAMSTVTFTQSGGNPAIAWSQTGLPTGVDINTSNGQVTGTPSVTGTFNVTITATDVGGCTGSKNQSVTVAPVAGNDAYTGLVDNTQLVITGGTTGSPATPFVGKTVKLIDNDQPAGGVTATAGTFATSAGGSVTIAADGTFIYTPKANPGAARTTADSFTYTVFSNTGAGAAVTSAPATVNLTLVGRVWYVLNTAAGGGNGQSQSPFNTLSAAIAASTAGASATDTDTIYVYQGDGTTTNLATASILKSLQSFIGQGVALVVNSNTLVAAGGFPLIGNTLTLANTVTVNGIDMSTGANSALVGANTISLSVTVRNLTTTTGTALNLSGATHPTGTVALTKLTTSGGGSGAVHVSLTNSDATVTVSDNTSSLAGAGANTKAIDINGGTGSFTYTGTISNTGSTGTNGGGISVANKTGTSTVTLSGATITLNTGANTAFTMSGNSAGTTVTINPAGGGNGLDITTTTGNGFSATGGGTVTVQGAGNTISSGTGTALNVANTTIGASGLTFQSISANGGTNGIVLNTTGSSGGLTVTGDGGSTNNSSGGTIQNTTSHGISLNSTQNVSLDQMNIQSTGGSGINGTAVTNFSFTNGTINNSGNAVGEANIAFNGSGSLTGNNLAGTLTVTGSTLTNAFDHGLHVEGNAGTVSNATITGNTITSTTSTATSKGSGIQLVGAGNASTVSNLTKATISNNTIRNFPSGAGIQVIYGNTSATGPAGNAGTPGNATNIIAITNNTVRGFDATNRFGTDAIAISINGGNSSQRSQGNFDVSNNGTVAEPIGDSLGAVILIGNNGWATMTATMNNNVMVGNTTVASPGISGGNGIVVSTAETPDLTLTASGNNISQTDGNGILLVSRGVTGLAKLSIKNNTVAAPLTGVRPGIRVDAGNATSVDDAVCLDISGNTSAGSGGSRGIGLRKQGTTSTTDDFGVEGMAATSSPGVEAFVDGQNPAGGGTLLISATSGFSNCNTAP